MHTLKTNVSSRIGEYKELYQKIVIERQWKRKVSALENKVERAKKVLGEQIMNLEKYKEVLEKRSDNGSRTSEYLNNIEKALTIKKEELDDSKEQLRRYQRLCKARRIKILYTLGYVFFNDTVQPIFKTLGKLKSNTTEKTDIKISNTLGFVVLFAIKLSAYLSVPLPFPMTYGGPRSSIRRSKTEDLSLFLTSKGERIKFNKGIELLIQNLIQLASFCGINFESQYMHDPNIHLIELLLWLKKHITQSIIYES